MTPSPDARALAERWLNEHFYIHAPSDLETLATLIEQYGQERDAALRLDERQACWEDIVHVVRQAIEDSPGSFELKALHEAIYVEGWKDFGTGDGKPQHKRKDSAVNEWTRTLAARDGSK
jgi:hypothetical protein